MTSMTKRIVGGLTALGLALASTACAPTQDTMEPAASVVQGDGPAMWRVADEDTTIYIFGTVHALPPEIDWYSGPVKTALDSSDTLVTEIDMSPEALARIPVILQQTAMLPEGTTVRSLMDDQERATFEAALTKLGIPINALDQLEPWYAAIQLGNAAFARAGFDPSNGTETVLERTVGDTKGRDALETAEMQLAIFDELPMDAQVDYLIESAEQLDEVAPFLEALVAEWAEGDIEALGNLMNEALEADPVLAERLLYARNANWAVWIDDRLDTPGTIFMAVGAGHLAGKEKLQDKLAERGIEIVRVQ